MNKLITIDAGHGGNDPGAVGNGLQEKNIVLNLALRLGKLLSSRGIEVFYTRNIDIKVELADRAKIANDKRTDLFISLHCNAAASPSAAGIETLVHNMNSSSADIAIIVQRELITRTNMVDRGVKPRPDLAVLRLSNMPAILIELGFISNAGDASKLKSDTFLDCCALAISETVCKHFKMPNIHEQPIGISNWAIEPRKWCVENGISDGTRAKDNITREEAWTMLYNFNKKFPSRS